MSDTGLQAKAHARSVRTGEGRWRALPWGRAVTAIDLDGDTLRVAQAARRGGRVRITRYAATRLDSDGLLSASPRARGEAVQEALQRLEVRARAVILGVPRAEVMLRTLTLPPVDRSAEIASMVYFQVSRDLPFPVDEAVIDYMVLPPTARALPNAGSGSKGAEAEGGVRVLTAVVKRSLIEEYRLIARAAGFKLAGVGLRSLANARCLELCRLAPAEHGVGLISLRSREVVFDVLQDGALAFSRVGPVSEPFPPAKPASADAQPSPEYVQEVLLEAVRGLHNYEGIEGHGQVSRFVVGGSTGAEAAVVEALTAHFSLPGSILNPVDFLGLKAEGNGATGAQAAFGLAQGALDPGGLPLDFLRPKRPPVQRDLRRLKTLAALAGAATLAFGIVGLRAYLINGRVQERVALQAQLNLANGNVKAYRFVRAQAAAVHSWEAEGQPWLDHLAWLSGLLPPSPELYVTSLSTGSKNSITLAVKVSSGEILNRVDSALRAAGYGVKPSAITPASDRNGYRFQANLELDVSAVGVPDLAELEVPERPSDDVSLPDGTARPSPPPEASGPDGSATVAERAKRIEGTLAELPPSEIARVAKIGAQRDPGGQSAKDPKPPKPREGRERAGGAMPGAAAAPDSRSDGTVVGERVRPGRTNAWSGARSGGEGRPTGARRRGADE